jgi:hypothetical protein
MSEKTCCLLGKRGFITIACLGGANRLGFGTRVGLSVRAWARAWSRLCLLGFGAGSECGLGYVGHVEHVYLRRQGPTRLSWGSKRVRVWHSRAGGGL